MNNAPSSPAMFSVTDQEKPMPVVFHRLNIVPGGARMTSSDPPGALTDAFVNGTIKRLFTAAPDSGHGGNAMIRSSNPIMFFVQVLLGLLFVPAWLSPMNNAPSSPAMFSVTDQEKPMPVVFHRLNIVPGGARMTSSDPPGALTDAFVNGTIKRLFTAAPDSGHGGNAMIRSSNPIMFFVQVLLGLLFVPAWLSPMNNAPSSPAMFSVTDQEKPMPVVFHRLNIVPGGARMTSSDPPGAHEETQVVLTQMEPVQPQSTDSSVLEDHLEEQAVRATCRPKSAA
ncbi:hypothetical protein MRX96_044547 [Rhipicephalus microplus]